MTARRRNGEGTVYRRGNGYEAAITVDGRRRTARAATRREAEAALRRLVSLREVGRLPRSGAITVGQWIENWLPTTSSLRYSTHRRYCELLRLHVVPRIGGVRLADLRPSHLSRLYADLQAEPGPLAAGTVIHVHRVLSAALKAAEADEYLLRNPARFVKPPQTFRAAPEALNIDEVRTLIDACRGEWLGPLFVVAVMTGLRQGELLGLRWADVRLGRDAWLSVTGSQQRAERGRVRGNAKTPKSMSKIPLPEAAVLALKTQRRAQNLMRLSAATPWPAEDDLVFTDEAGAPLNPDRVRRHWRRFCAAHDLPSIQFKNLRHTLATLHLDTGEPVDVVADVLRHTRAATTMAFYRRREPRHLREAANKLEVLLTQPDDGVAGGVAGGPTSEGGSA
jgi:integrase